MWETSQARCWGVGANAHDKGENQQARGSLLIFFQRHVKLDHFPVDRATSCLGYQVLLVTSTLLTHIPAVDTLLYPISFARLCAIHLSIHSVFTLTSSRLRNCQPLRAEVMTPKTPSTTGRRRA